MEKKNPILQFSLPKNHIPLIPEKIRQVGKLFEHCKSKTDKRNKETRNKGKRHRWPHESCTSLT